MDTLQNELAELKQFIVELKADRAAAKEKERREAWTKWVSMSIVIIAVLSGIAAQRAGKYSSATQMSQVQASDQWNFYQALSIKQHLFEINRRPLPKDATDAETIQAHKEYEAKIADYNQRKLEMKAKAEALEARRDASAHLGSRLGPAVSCFTVAIAVGSICLTTKKKPLWIVSLLLATAGLLYWGGVMELLGKT